MLELQSETMPGSGGAFDVEVFSDGFHVANSADGETLEISNVGSSIMLVSSTVGDDVVSVTVASDGNEVACDVAVFDDKAREARVPCSVARVSEPCSRASRVHRIIRAP